MCGEGDIAGIADLLNSINKEDGDMPAAELVRYQDTLDSNRTGLHLAVEKQQFQTL